MSGSARIEFSVRKAAPLVTGLGAIPAVLRHVLCGHAEPSASRVPHPEYFQVGNATSASREPYREPTAAVRERHAWERILGDALSG